MGVSQEIPERMGNIRTVTYRLELVELLNGEGIGGLDHPLLCWTCESSVPLRGTGWHPT